MAKVPRPRLPSSTQIETVAALFAESGIIRIENAEDWWRIGVIPAPASMTGS